MPNPRRPKAAQRAGKKPAAAGDGSNGALFDDAPVPMHDIDRDGIIRRVNRAECELLGLSPEEIVGRHVSELVAPAEREASRQAVSLKISGEQPLAPFRREFLRRNGDPLKLEIHEDLIRDADGNVTGIRSALMDVSERHRAEEHLRQSHDELETRVRERTLELARANKELRREVAERRRAEQRLAAQYAVARVLAESDAVEAAIAGLLEAIA
jgi:PAS domain S-box-containing protein